MRQARIIVVCGGYLFGWAEALSVSERLKFSSFRRLRTGAYGDRISETSFLPLVSISTFSNLCPSLNSRVCIDRSDGVYNMAVNGGVYR